MKLALTPLLIALLGLAGTAPLAAQTAPGTDTRGAPTVAGTPWEALSEADRAALAQPIRERWNQASPEQQRRYLERARLWASLSPEQKRLARAGVERYRRADGEQRGRLREVWQRLQALPEAEREAARRTWASLTPAQRRQWLEAGGPGVAPPPQAEGTR
ncbi:MAG: DUF3106 domain-containing protein [Lysobacteraceae bacterium]|jgi:hypothetical protein|nr:DUF3106 domain-containing protein [Xanthomonadaceae bacterium]MCZ8318942.1 DUF3106 domain-containing protein [Silanimonas sp.]